jgi:hypothetical protein
LLRFTYGFGLVDAIRLGVGVDHWSLRLLDEYLLDDGLDLRAELAGLGACGVHLGSWRLRLRLRPDSADGLAHGNVAVLSQGYLGLSDYSLVLFGLIVLKVNFTFFPLTHILGRCLHELW